MVRPAAPIPQADPPPSPTSSHRSSASSAASLLAGAVPPRKTSTPAQPARKPIEPFSSDSEASFDPEDGELDGPFDLVEGGGGLESSIPSLLSSISGDAPRESTQPPASATTSLSGSGSDSEHEHEHADDGRMRLSFPDPIHASSSSSFVGGGASTASISGESLFLHSDGEDDGDHDGEGGTANSIVRDGGDYSLLLDVAPPPLLSGASSSTAQRPLVDKAVPPPSPLPVVPATPAAVSHDSTTSHEPVARLGEAHGHDREDDVGSWVRAHSVRTAPPAASSPLGAAVADKGVQASPLEESSASLLTQSAMTVGAGAGKSLDSSQATVVPAAKTAPSASQVPAQPSADAPTAPVSLASPSSPPTSRTPAPHRPAHAAAKTRVVALSTVAAALAALVASACVAQLRTHGTAPSLIPQDGGSSSKVGAAVQELEHGGRATESDAGAIVRTLLDSLLVDGPGVEGTASTTTASSSRPPLAQTVTSSSARSPPSVTRLATTAAAAHHACTQCALATRCTQHDVAIATVSRPSLSQRRSRASGDDRRARCRSRSRKQDRCRAPTCASGNGARNVTLFGQGTVRGKVLEPEVGAERKAWGQLREIGRRWPLSPMLDSLEESQTRSHRKLAELVRRHSPWNLSDLVASTSPSSLRRFAPAGLGNLTLLPSRDTVSAHLDALRARVHAHTAAHSLALHARSSARDSARAAQRLRAVAAAHSHRAFERMRTLGGSLSPSTVRERLERGPADLSRRLARACRSSSRLDARATLERAATSSRALMHRVRRRYGTISADAEGVVRRSAAGVRVEGSKHVVRAARSAKRLERAVGRGLQRARRRMGRCKGWKEELAAEGA
ncbi:hypothetical protein Rhopal_006415-T1 [Rhodotorula paludigena]|uniref:Proteophosphoglycan ppg4 n=1 Tax=Rhodotorula paludigena TaxID=86838 RepID=A0AAV5GV51_9BASI|nr:hypothetical protein Rhopal_006415-T1 [Rhodotorula paludigena]